MNRTIKYKSKIPELPLKLRVIINEQILTMFLITNFSVRHVAPTTHSLCSDYDILNLITQALVYLLKKRPIQIIDTISKGVSGTKSNIVCIENLPNTGYGHTSMFYSSRREFIDAVSSLLYEIIFNNIIWGKQIFISKNFEWLKPYEINNMIIKIRDYNKTCNVYTLNNNKDFIFRSKTEPKNFIKIFFC